MRSSSTASATAPEALPRGLGLRGAVALNMIDMIGVGPFITIPLILAAMGGPQAMLGWVLGLGFALCDGMIWAELGASLPAEGGSYHYLSRIFGPERWGRLFSFLYVWQLLFSGPLMIASGCIGLALYATYLWPGLNHPLVALGPHLALSQATLLAMASCLLALLLAYRQIRWIDRAAQWLWWGVLATVLWVIWAGVTHFHVALAFALPPGALTPSAGFFGGLAAALVIAFYDYTGYQSANFLAGEIIQPERTLPRAIVISTVLVGVLYLVMNISILGVLPWREIAYGAGAQHAVSLMMERVYGSSAAQFATWLILWTAFASVFSLLVTYSRAIFAAAEDGNFFRSFARLHPRHRFPWVALLALGLVSTAFCIFRLDQVIAALVAIQLLVQYLAQAVGLIALRRCRPETPRSFRMPLYPLPALLAIAGFVFLLLWPDGALRLLSYGLLVLASGVAAYFIRLRPTGKVEP